MDRHSLSGRTVVILTLLCLAMILTSGCVSDLVIRKNLVIFRMNETGVQTSAVPLLIDYPRYESYLSRPPVGRTCDGGLLAVNGYFTIRPREGPGGNSYNAEYHHWFRIDKIAPDGRIAWEEIRPARESYPFIDTIREYPDGFVVAIREGENFTLEKPVRPDPAFFAGKCPELIYPGPAEAEPGATGTMILATIQNSSSSGMHAFPTSYVYITDSSLRDWNGFQKVFWNLFEFTGISNVRDDGFTLDVNVFDRTGNLQSAHTLRWQPETGAERIGNCEYTIRSVPVVYPAPDGGYFVATTLQCYG